jgi:hypothetical protein
MGERSSRNDDQLKPSRPKVVRMNPQIAAAEFFTSKDFFYTFLSAISGVVIGVLWTEWRSSCRERKRRKVELALLRSALMEAKELVKQAIAQYKTPSKPPGVPNFTLDVSGLIRRVERLQGLVSSPLLAAVDRLRFQMEHVSLKMITVYHLAASGNNVLTHPEIASCQAHLEMIEGWINDRLEDITVEEHMNKTVL